MSALTRHRPRLALSISCRTLCLCLLLGGGSLAASVASQTAFADNRSYNVPAVDLATALTRFAGEAGVSLSVDPHLVSGRPPSPLRNTQWIDPVYGLDIAPCRAGV